jgi:hypothetical protein
MAFLQRVLKVQALLWALFGLLLVARPVVVAEGLLGLDPPTGTTLLRVFGVTAIVVAMLMVLVSQHAAEAWWWAWAFALLQAGVATVCVIHALFGAAESAPALPWWIAGAVSALFCVLDLVGLARAEQAKPIA